MTPQEKALAAFRSWYASLPRPKSAGGGPAKGSIAVGLIILERLKSNFDLNLSAHLAPGGAQIQGASGPAVRAILAAFKETRRFVGEGGRTNRGVPAVAAALLKAIGSAGLDAVDEEKRREVLTSLQAELVEKVREFHSRERLKPIYDPAQTTRHFIADLLALAEETGKYGPVAQYLVGAKLKLRFPEVEVRNESYSAADNPSGQPGDFVIGDTTFHIAVAPSQGNFDRCLRNLRDGRRVFLLVADSCLPEARQNAESAAPGQIAVESIESFVANLIDLQAAGSATTRATILAQLCETFNALVLQYEPEEWLHLEIVGITDDPYLVVERVVG